MRSSLRIWKNGRMSLSFVVDNKDNKESLSPAVPSLSLKEVLFLPLLNITIVGHTGMLSVPPTLGKVLNKQHLSDREARLCYCQSQTTPKIPADYNKSSFLTHVTCPSMASYSFNLKPRMKKRHAEIGHGEPLPASGSLCLEVTHLASAHMLLTKPSCVAPLEIDRLMVIFLQGERSC